MADEIRRCAARGARAVTFPENPVPLGQPSLSTDHWDPIWQACVETDTVVCMHIGTSGVVPMAASDSPFIQGIALASTVMCAAELKAGSLVRLLRDYRLDPVPVHAVFPGGPRPSAKVRAFVDYLERALRTDAP